MLNGVELNFLLYDSCRLPLLVITLGPLIPQYPLSQALKAFSDRFAFS